MIIVYENRIYRVLKIETYGTTIISVDTDNIKTIDNSMLVRRVNVEITAKID